MASTCCGSSKSTRNSDASAIMKFHSTPIQDVVLIEPQVFGDARGFFLETWQTEKFAAAGIDATFVQDNHSRSSRWTLRGLHFQTRAYPRQAGARRVRQRVRRGGRFAPQLAESLATWWGVELSAENHLMLWVPKGLAHGILVTSEYADFLVQVHRSLQSRARENAGLG